MITSIAIFLSCFLLSFIASTVIVRPQDTKAVTGLSLAGAASMTLSTSSNNVTLQLTPSGNGTLASGSHSLTATTNVPTGYNLGLAATALSANPSSLNSSLTATAGTITSPTALANNTWGYALASTSAVGVVNDFDASYAVPTPSSTSRWANPTANTIIKNTTGIATSDTTTVYYGARANMAATSSNYVSTVTYTATANISTISAPSIVSITPTSGTTAGGTAIEIRGTGFTVNDRSVTTNVTIGGQACTNVSISSNTPITGQDTTYCNTPAHSTAGGVNVVVTTWKSTVTLTNGYTYAAPTPTITAPTANQIFNAGTTSTTLTVTTNYPAICFYGTATNPTTQMTTTGATTHSQSITGLTNASTNTRYVRCQAATGHSYSTSVSVTFYVKAAAPTLSISAPTASQIFAAGTTSTTLTVTTNVSATCYYGTATNPTTQMTTTGSTTHSQSITGLTNASTNTRYVRCRASSGNTISDYSSNVSVTFYVRTATPAAPTLSPANGTTVNNGTTTITVTSSGATCTWGTSSGSYPNASGTTRTTTTGTNTLYYSCIAGSGNTQSEARTGSWSYTGQVPIAQTGDMIQTVTTANCPNTRIRVNDARDNRSYWVQKLADGKCWMLTNLAYGGGGTNTYGDVRSITNSNTANYTQPYFMIPTGANATSGTTNPSTSTSGIGQYGYLYNWCAAMGAQASTAACSNTTTPAPNVLISVCPSGWRLPSGGSGGEFTSLNSAVNSSMGSTDVGLRSNWLGMYSGLWNSTGFNYLGANGYYWSFTQYSSQFVYAFTFFNSGVNLVNYYEKPIGLAVRCVAT